MAVYHYQSESEDDGDGSDGEEGLPNRRTQAPPHASCCRWRDDDSDSDFSSESEEEEDDDVEVYQDSELATELFGVKINRGQKQGEEDEDDGGDGGEEADKTGDDDENEGDNNDDADDGDNNEHNEGGQSSPVITWNQKRDELINMLADNSHDIHLISGRTKKDRCEKMYRRYADQFDEKKVVTCLSRLLLELKKKEGPFDPAKGSKKGKKTKDGKPHWKSRKKGKNSEEHDLLYLLRIRTEGGTGIDKMSAEEIWNTYPIFQKHDAIIKLILLGMFKCLLSLQGFAEPIYSYDIIRYVEVTDNYIVWYIYIPSPNPDFRPLRTKLAVSSCLLKSSCFLHEIYLLICLR